jgi:hypothetical protein
MVDRQHLKGQSQRLISHAVPQFGLNNSGKVTTV